MNPVRLMKTLAFPVIALLIVFGTHSSLFAYAALGLSAVYLVMAGVDEALYLLVFLLNMANIFKPGPDSTSFYTYLIFLYVLRVILQKRQLEPLILLFAAYLVIIQIVNQNIDALKTIKLIVYMLLISYVMNNKETFRMDRILAFYVAGVLLASVVTYLDSDFFRISALSLTKQLGRSYGYGDVARFSGLDTDPNYYSVAVIISMCIVVLFYHKKKINAVLMIAILSGLFSFVIQTYSKSAFLMSALPIVVLLYGNAKAKRKGMQIFFVVLLGAVGLYMLSGKADFLDIIMTRFSAGKTDVGSLTTGRSVIWNQYFNDFREHILRLFFGVGVSSPFARSHAAHNTYIEMLHSVGVIGSMLFLVSLRTPIRATKVRKNLLNYSIGFCIFVMYFFLSEMFYYDSVFHLLIAKIVFDMDFDFSGASAPKKLIIGDASPLAAKNPFRPRAAEPVTAVERGH